MQGWSVGRRSRRWFVLPVAVAAVAALLLEFPGVLSVSGAASSSQLSDGLVALPHLDITFAANSTAEVTSLITTDKPYIEAGDSFDLDSGSPSTMPLNVTAINYWASLLRATYPDAAIYAHTSGLAHYTTLAEEASANISGIYYDYEPRYEPEFTWNFTQTLSEFANVTAIAHAHHLLSIGYPTGRPLAKAKFQSYQWDYGTLAGTVDQLVVQTQVYCHDRTAAFENAVRILLDQYAIAGVAASPTVQVTIGNNSTLTPNQVSPHQAYECAQVLTNHGLHTLYLWWGPSDNVGVLHFLKDIGRAKAR